MAETIDIPENQDIQTDQAQPSVVPPNDPTPKEKLYNLLNGKGIYTKSYNDFQQQFNNPTSIGKLHSLLEDKGIYTKGADNFNQQFFSTKVPSTSSNSVESPEPVNPIKTLRDLNKVATTPPPTTTTVIDPTMGGGTVTVDQSAIDAQNKAKSDYDNQIKTLSKSWGVNSDNLNQVLNDFPNDTEPDRIKEKLQLLSDNPKTYARQKAATENTYLIANSKEGGIHAANDYNHSQEQPGEYVPLPLKEGRIVDQITKINTYLSGDDREKATDNLEKINSTTFNVVNPDIIHAYNNSDLKGKLDATQFAALEQLRIFHPDKYQQYISILT